MRYGLPMIWTATVYRLPGFSIVIRNGMYMDVDRYMIKLIMRNDMIFFHIVFIICTKLVGNAVRGQGNEYTNEYTNCFSCFVY